VDGRFAVLMDSSCVLAAYSIDHFLMVAGYKYKYKYGYKYKYKYGWDTWMDGISSQQVFEYTIF